ncbi:MAG: hypothetical protein ACI8WB_001241 [Phenylobacterium sp.]|jgi:hypothetical protein
MNIPGTLKKMGLAVCNTDADGNVTGQQAPFTVMLNPSSFKHDAGISYNHDQEKTCAQTTPMGNLAYQLKFQQYEPEKVSFDLVLDGTGVVSVLSLESVSDQLTALKAVIYNYDGSKHEPNIVQLSWGDFIFNGRLTSMNVDYSLFHSSGNPLRAKVSLSFTSYMSVEAQIKVEKKSSPDLSHVIVVKAGDTLPLLCQQVYQQSRYYLEIAKVNKLDSFRQLLPGTTLFFPPLR